MLAFMHALNDRKDLSYVLGLQESVVVAMADGFARASGSLTACNVHVAPGLGNAIGSIYNAYKSGSPLLITAGQQEQGHGCMEGIVDGGNGSHRVRCPVVQGVDGEREVVPT